MTDGMVVFTIVTSAYNVQRNQSDLGIKYIRRNVAPIQCRFAGKFYFEVAI
jgi:hypothetical protein